MIFNFDIIFARNDLLAIYEAWIRFLLYVEISWAQCNPRRVANGANWHCATSSLYKLKVCYSVQGNFEKKESNLFIIWTKHWSRIGHTLRRPPNDITRQCLDWNPIGKRQRRRPRNTWRRTVQNDLKGNGKAWTEMKVIAQNRTRWRKEVSALCSVGNGKH